MATRTDFWGDIEPAQVRTPAAILREQAALLGTKTQNLVEARVETDIDQWHEFNHRFLLVVPALSNYSYQLFRVEHGVNLYPVRVDRESLRLENEEAFIEWLRRTLSSAETKRIIGNLLAQVNS